MYILNNILNLYNLLFRNANPSFWCESCQKHANIEAAAIYQIPVNAVISIKTLAKAFGRASDVLDQFAVSPLCPRYRCRA